MFTQFGTVLDVVALKTLRMRGQAFVVFKDIASGRLLITFLHVNLTFKATHAMRTMQNFPFYDKPMKIQYAKGKSDVIAKLDGTYVARSIKKGAIKRKAEEPPEGTILHSQQLHLKT